MDFLSNLIEKARKEPKRIVFPETEDERILKAALRVKNDGIAVPILVGPEETTRAKAASLNLDLGDIQIVDPAKGDVESFAKEFMELRKGKLALIDDARKMVAEPIYWGTMMVHLGEADGLISGASHPTAHTLRPALQILKTAEGRKLASSFFFEISDQGLMFYADCGFVIDPNPEELADIALATAESAKFFGIEPRVAMLSFSTHGSAKHPMVDKVVEATRIAKERAPDLLLDGELQFDAAYVEKVAQKKCPDSPIGGKANVFIFPNLDAGNIAYKITQRIGQVTSLGPIIQGIRRPVNDLSRGCSVDDVYGITAITVIQAQAVGR